VFFFIQSQIQISKNEIRCIMLSTTFFALFSKRKSKNQNSTQENLVLFFKIQNEIEKMKKSDFTTYL